MEHQPRFQALDIAEYQGTMVTILGVDPQKGEYELRKGSYRANEDYIGWVPASEVTPLRNYEYLVSEDRGKSFRIVATGLWYIDIALIQHRAQRNGRVEGTHYYFRDNNGVRVTSPSTALSSDT